MNTHKVVCAIAGTNNALFCGTEKECNQWRLEQGFGYKVVTLKKGDKEFEFVYSQDEVKQLIEMIYSEFAELPLKMHTTYNLRSIIEQEIENHALKPIKIFK